jgi:hypothetical protein
MTQKFFFKPITDTGYLFILMQLKSNCDNLKIIFNLPSDASEIEVKERILELKGIFFEVWIANHDSKQQQDAQKQPSESLKAIGVGGICYLDNYHKLVPQIFASLNRSYNDYEAPVLEGLAEKCFNDFRHQRAEVTLFRAEKKLADKLTKSGFVKTGTRDKCMFENGDFQDVIYLQRIKV